MTVPICLIGRKNGSLGSKHDLDDIIGRFVSYFKGQNPDKKFYTDQETFNHFLSESVAASHTEEFLRNNAKVVITFGGDGTMVNAAKRFPGIPILGVNLGKLGFITDIPVSHGAMGIYRIARDVINSNFDSYVTEKRTMINLTIGNSLALNEIAIRSTGSIIEFEVRVDGELAYQCRGDGLIVSTPTGSTAYALSAGGSIIHPTSKVLELVPMVPQTLSCRPLIVNDSSKIDVKIISGEAMVLADGQIVLNSTKHVMIELDKKTSTFVHPKSRELNYSYFGMLREKLNWQHLPTA